MGPKDKSKKHKRDKKHKEKKKHKRRYSSSDDSSSSSAEDEWVEKKQSSSESDEEQQTSQSNSLRDEWMDLPTAFSSESNRDRRQERQDKKRLEKEREKYNPRSNVRELNPYWKDGGEGLPSFKKPSEDNETTYTRTQSSSRPKPTSNWRKKHPEEDFKKEEKVHETLPTQDASDEPVLTDKELNLLASKLVKAEIMKNTKLIAELKAKLERARRIRETAPPPSSREEAVLLTEMNSQGQARPIRPQADPTTYSGNVKKKKKVETHQDGERVRYFADDDNQSLKEMFENEKFNSVEDQNNQFIQMASQIRKNDDLDEVFADSIRQKQSDAKVDARNRDRAINEHKKVSENIDRCRLCLQSDSMAKHLMVSVGGTAFLSLPSHEPLTEGHCLISPIRHVSSSTLLDENEWSDILDIRKALTRMFLARNEDVIFFETAKNLDKYPHMSIECIPVDKEEGDMAPIYFKKAIDECEGEWAQNKKLVSLKGRDVRKAIPKGLGYFFVSFGMEEGYAHVIEDQASFPNNFAQEIIGGMLDVHHSKWRKPKHQSFDEQSKRVLEFSKNWSNFDCTNKQ